MPRQSHQAVGRSRHEGRVGERAARWADPVLAAPELAWRGSVAAHATHQLLVQLTHQAQRERQGTQSLDAVFERDDVVADLAQIGGAALDRRSGFGGEQLAERGLRAFDPAREHRLAANEGPDQEMRIRQPPSFASQPADRSIRRGERGRQPVAPLNAWRQRLRDEGVVAALTANQAAVRLALGSGRHDLLVSGGENSAHHY